MSAFKRARGAKGERKEFPPEPQHDVQTSRAAEYARPESHPEREARGEEATGAKGARRESPQVSRDVQTSRAAEYARPESHPERKARGEEATGATSARRESSPEPHDVQTSQMTESARPERHPERKARGEEATGAKGIRKTWRVEGMHCPRCEVAVRRALAGATGISEIDVSFQKGTLSALWDAKLLPEADIDARLREAGYGLVRGSSRAAWLGDGLRLLAALAAAGLLYLLLTRTAVADWTRAFPTAREGMGLGALFAVGLATSLHCVAMCGGINLAQSAASAQRGAKPTRANLLYNLGRLCSYTLIGGIVGALGTALSITPTAKAAIQILAAAFMLLMALNLLGGFSWIRRLTPRLPEGLSARLFGFFAGKSFADDQAKDSSSTLSSAAGGLAESERAKPSKYRAGKSSFLIGLANGLMPCGPLQAMQLYALSAGSWWRGAISMFCFCLGTIPLMLGVGLVSGKLNARFAKPMRYASAALVLAMGVSALASGLALAGVDVQGAAPTQLRVASSSSAEEPSGEDGVAVVRDGVQYVCSELDYGGYPEITVRAGIPVEWTIHAEESRINSCNHEIYIPKFDLSVPLEPGDNLIRFTPEAAGTIPYTCWMGMIQSAIYVTEGPTK